MKFGKLIQKNRQEIIRIVKAHGANTLQIFGSFASGDDQPESDIDLLVELEAGRSLLDMIAIKHEIEDITKRKVDIVTKASLSPYIIEDILQDAVEL